MVLVQKDRRALERLQGVAVLDEAGHAHRVDLRARGEHEGEPFVHVSLVVVGDSAGEVKRIGPVGVQVRLEIDDQRLSGHPELGLLLQGRGQEDVVGVLDRHVLVEGELELGIVRRHVDCPGKGRGLQKHRRYGILRPARRRRGGIRAPRREHHRPEDQGGRDERKIFLESLHIRFITGRCGTPSRCPRWW